MKRPGPDWGPGRVGGLREKRDQDNDRDRDAQKPQQYTAHRWFSSVRSRRRGKLAAERRATSRDLAETEKGQDRQDDDHKPNQVNDTVHGNASCSIGHGRKNVFPTRRFLAGRPGLGEEPPPVR